jgi:hypothetical protein
MVAYHHLMVPSTNLSSNIWGKEVIRILSGTFPENPTSFIWHGNFFI